MKKAETDIDVAKWIIKHREKKGWTQKQLADEVDVSQTLVCFWEKGSQRPNPEMREKLVEVFGAGFGDEESFGKSFGEWLRSKREERKLTIRKLADKARLSWLAIKNIEDGNVQSPHKATLKSLEKILGKLPAVQSRDVEEARRVVGGFEFEGVFDIKEWESKVGEKIPCIYVIYDKSLRPVRIGQTKDLRTRFKQYSEKVWWNCRDLANKYAYIIVKEEEFRLKAEEVMIKLVGKLAILNKQNKLEEEPQTD